MKKKVNSMSILLIVLLTLTATVTLPPMVTTGSATDVTASSATLNGTVSAYGFDTTAWFEHSLTSAIYSSTPSKQSVIGTNNTPVSASISGLSDTKTYYRRIAAKNDARTVYGNETSFMAITPINVSPQISAGTSFSATLMSNGTVWTWGNDDWGQLGDGDKLHYHSDSSSEFSETPVQSNLSGVTAIDCGGLYTLALKFDGTVWAWGSNRYGQLGDYKTSGYYKTTPLQVCMEQIENEECKEQLSDIIAIAGGGSHSLALKSDGTVWAWGNNEYGQLGDGTIESRTNPMQVSGLSGVIAIAGGGSHSLALKSDGTVWAWGNNAFGKLGDGTTTNRNTPIQVSGLSDVIAIAGGAFHSIALKSDGTVWTWGINDDGQLGDGTIEHRTTPVQVSGLNGVIAIAGGGDHTIALKSNGTVWTWGANSRGQLGDGTTNRRTTPVQVNGLNDVIAIAGGADHTIAMKSDGTVWAWGHNGNGQLGDGTYGTYKTTPVQALINLEQTETSTPTPTPTPSVVLSSFLIQDGSDVIPINFSSTDGDPIALQNGEFVMEVIDLQIPGRGFDFAFTRVYKSRVTYNGPLGHNWDFNYNSRLIEITEDNQDAIPTDIFTPVRSGSFTKLGSVVVMDGHGRSDLYGLQSDGTYSTPLGAYTRLTKNEDGSFTLRDRAGNEKFYDKNGSLVQQEDRHGNTMTLTRDEGGKLTEVIDTLGRKITYNYNSDGRLTEVKDFADRSIKFEYDSNGDLVSVTSPSVTGTPNGNDFPDGKTTKYTYSSGFDDEKLNHNLLTITAPNEVATGGSPRIINVYETDADSYAYGRVITQTYGGTNASGIEAGGDIVYEYEELTSNPASTNEPVNRVTVTDRNGNKTVYEHNKLGNAVSIKEYTKGFREDEPEFFETSFEYNVDGQRVKSTLPEGNSVENTYASEDTESIDYKKSRFKHGNLLENKQIPDSDRGGDQQQITPTYTYELIYNRVRTETDPRGNDTTYEPPNGGTRSAERYTTTYYFDYQEGNNLDGLAKVMGISSEEVQEMLDEAGIELSLGDLNGDGITDYVSGDVVKIVRPTVTLLSDSNQAKLEGDASQEKVELFVYNKYGQITSKTDAEGNVTTYDYYPENDPDGDGKDKIEGKGNGHFGYLKEVIVDTTSSSERNSGTNPKPVKIKTQYFYDSVGNIVKEINRRGIATEYVVNELNQQVKITRAAAVPGSKGKKKKTALKAFKYVTLIEYDYNNNVVKKEVENRDSNNSDLAGEFIEYTYTYDILDHLVKETQEISETETLVTEYRYDANENRIKIIYPEGNYQETIYDERDRLFRTTNECGCSGGSPNTTYNYDKNGNPIEVIDGEDNNGDGKNDSALYEYDGYNRLIKTTDPVGNVTERVFDPAGNVTKVSRWGIIGGSSRTDNSGSGNVLLSQTEYSFDELNRQYQKDDVLFVSSGVSTVRTPLLQDGPLGTSDDGKVTTRYEYDRKGRRTFMIEDDGDVFEYRYDGADRRIAQVDPEGNRADYTYDENNNVTKTVETEVTQEGNSPSLTEKFTTINVYDALNRLVRTTDNIGQTRRFGYDSRDNLIFSSDAQGKKVKDKEGLFKGSINEDGNTVYYFYDGINRRTKEERDLRKGGLGSGDIDTTNSANPDGKITIVYEYDGNSRLVSITDDNGNITRYEYDDADRKTQETNADGTTKKFEYDQDNNLVKMTDENGSVIDFSYDALNRVTQKDITRASGIIGTTQQSFEYDGLSRVTKSFDNNDPDDDTDDATVTYASDSMGRLIEEVQNGQAISSQWDGDNNRLALIYPNGRKIETTYDKLDKIDRIKDADATSNIADYDYIGPGRVLERKYSNGIRLSYLDDSRTKDIGYDKLRRPIKLRHLTEGNKLIAGFEHGYDRENNKLFETRLHAFKGKKNTGDVYKYDSVYRLTTFKRDVVNPKKVSGTKIHSEVHYSPHPNPLPQGERENGSLSQGKSGYKHSSPFTEIAGNHSTSSSTEVARDYKYSPPLMGGAGEGEGKPAENQTTYTFDGVGNWANLTIGSEPFENTVNEMNEYESFKGASQTHDDCGNLVDDGTNSYEYDFANRLRKVSKKTDSAVIAVYSYDAAGRRIRKVITNSGDLSGITVSYLDGGQEIEERDEAVTLMQQYVYGMYIDEPLVLDRNLDGNDSAIGEDDQRLFYHQNTLYSVFALTDTTATIVEGYKYDAYGQQTVIEPGLNGVVEFGGDDEITIEGMSAINNPYMFTGRRFDPETGLYYYRTRYLNKEQGRFIQRDFIGIWTDLINLGNGYTYVGSNPANRLDTYGTDSQTGDEANRLKEKLVLVWESSSAGQQASEGVQREALRLARGILGHIHRNYAAGWRGGWDRNWIVGIREIAEEWGINPVANALGGYTGKCYEWANSLHDTFNTINSAGGRLQYFRGVHIWQPGNPESGVGTHHAFAIYRNGGSYEEGLVIDPWRNDGLPFWVPVRGDSYEWINYPRLQPPPLRVYHAEWPPPSRANESTGMMEADADWSPPAYGRPMDRGLLD